MAFAPDLCITVGKAQLDLAGSTSLVKIGSSATKNIDGALANVAAVSDLVKRLEESES
jgi:hypothetical protein